MVLQPTPVLLLGKSHGHRSLVGCSPWGQEELDTTERLHFHFTGGTYFSCISHFAEYECQQNLSDLGFPAENAAQEQKFIRNVSEMCNLSPHPTPTLICDKENLHLEVHVFGCFIVYFSLVDSETFSFYFALCRLEQGKKGIRNCDRKVCRFYSNQHVYVDLCARSVG